MPAPPNRNDIAGSPTNATARTGFGALWDYVTTLLGASGTPLDARRALGVPADGPLSGMRNLLINGNFAINQRGYTSGSATSGSNKYTLDRWRVVVSGQSVTFAASGNGRVLTVPAGGFEQVIEGLSIEGGNHVLNWTGTATATVNGTARTKGEVFSLPANTNATVRFSGGTLEKAQLETGSVVTAFERRPYGLELSLCQRYYETQVSVRHWLSNAVAAQVVGGTGVYKVTKRAAPTSVNYSQASTGATTGSVTTLAEAFCTFEAVCDASGPVFINVSTDVDAEL